MRKRWKKKQTIYSNSQTRSKKLKHLLRLSLRKHLFRGLSLAKHLLKLLSLPIMNQLSRKKVLLKPKKIRLMPRRTKEE